MYFWMENDVQILSLASHNPFWKEYEPLKELLFLELMGPQWATSF